MNKLSSVEFCAGAGGQAFGLEQAGFQHLAVIEIDPHACQTLRLNRPKWNVIEEDIKKVDGSSFIGVDLLAAGVPCPPFSIAGKQLGQEDERDLFPEIIRLTNEAKPRAVMIENVRGLLTKKFDSYRAKISRTFNKMGYWCDWKLLNAVDFGVPQNRSRTIFIALQPDLVDYFSWPVGNSLKTKSVGDVLLPAMSEAGWRGAEEWARKANGIAPTIVGGSKKHGGPDLGPTRAKLAWEALSVNGKKIGDCPPEPDYEGMPLLTVKMASLIQGFPSNWEIFGRKTNAYRQVGNAFPPPVAKAVGVRVKYALLKQGKASEGRQLELKMV